MVMPCSRATRVRNLRQLEADTGIPRRFLTQVAREHGITMAGVSGPAGSRSRYRDRMPISLGPDAAAARQAASLFRVLANPTRLAILLTLQTGEQRIADLTAQLGGPQANISAHLTRLKQSGLITRRAHGRAVYYRLTQPELGALLQAARQLLPPAGQQATGEKDTTMRKTQRTNR